MQTPCMQKAPPPPAVSQLGVRDGTLGSRFFCRRSVEQKNGSDFLPCRATEGQSETRNGLTQPHAKSRHRNKSDMRGVQRRFAAHGGQQGPTAAAWRIARRILVIHNFCFLCGLCFVMAGFLETLAALSQLRRQHKMFVVIVTFDANILCFIWCT